MEDDCYYSIWKRSLENIEAVYNSVISEDGMLSLPVECLTSIFQSGDPSGILTNSLAEGVLSLYSHETFEEICRSLRCLNIMDPKVRRLKRRIIGESVEIKINKGQIKIQPEQLSKLNLDSKIDELCGQTVFPIVILKYSSRFEIISSTRYNELCD